MDQIDLYCEVTREKFLNQESTNREFGARAGTMLGFGAAMIAAGVITLNLSGIKLGPGVPAFWAFIALIVAFLSTATFSLLVLWPRSWGHGPTVSSLAKALGYYEDRDFTKLVGDAYKQSVDNNWCLLDRKAIFLGYGVASLAIEAGAVAAVGILRFWSP